MIRPLRKNWKLYAIAIFSLAMAMALSVVALSLSNAILLRPPFARDPERLVMLYTVARNGAQERFSYLNYQYVRDHSSVFSGVAGNNYGFSKTEIGFGDRDELGMLNTVSDNYFEVMGIQPFLGRFFSLGDDQKRAPAAVLTYACWKRWGADRGIAGKTVTLGRRPVTIVGVAPKAFIGPVFGMGADVIVNIAAMANIDPGTLEDREQRFLLLAGRLKPGITRAQARAELRALWGQLTVAFPEAERNHTAALADMTVLPPDDVKSARLLSAVLIAAALLILLIACANAANLLLVLATGRRQEALIKTALGAARSRLVGDFLKETAALCAAAGVLGYALASTALGWLSRFDLTVPVLGTFPISADLHPGGLVTGLTLGLIVLASVVSGLAPALYGSKINLATALSGEIAIGGTRRGIIRKTIVVIQVAVCTLVLAGAGLCLRSLHNLRRVDPGFSARKIVAVWIFLDSQGFSREQGIQASDNLRRGAERIAGVESVTLADGMPLGGESSSRGEIHFTDRPASGQKTFVDYAVIDENYFSTFGIRLLAGRAFRSSDREKSLEVIVINQFMAKKFWPGQNAIGRTIRVADANRPSDSRVATIVGVAADGKYDNLDEAPRPFFYYALGQHYQGGIMLIARTTGDPRLWAEPIARMVRKLGVKMPLPPTTMESWMNLTLFVPLLMLGCVSGLAVLATMLATVGLYGAISYSVSERRREMGIRIALGARPAQVMQLVFRETMTIAGTGVAAGLALGVAASVIFGPQFYGVHAVEWLVMAPVGMGMVGMSLGIAFGAAWRWTRMNPMDAVRHA